MKPFRCLLVDDERMARDNLRALLQEYPQWMVVGEAADVDQAAEAIARLAPDVVFLDIQLPGGSGFDLLQRLEHPPFIVFVTAYDRYAVRAFEVNALDYLLKPIDPARFRETLSRISSVPTPAARKERCCTAGLRMNDDVLIQSDRAYYFVHLADILTIAAAGNYTEVQTADGRTHLTRQSMAEWERRLPAEGFLKADRSLFLNLRQVRESSFSRRCALLLVGPGKLPIELGRAAATRLKRQFDGAASG
jgi:two-component system LytT family response regulator